MLQLECLHTLLLLLPLAMCKPNLRTHLSNTAYGTSGLTSLPSPLEGKEAANSELQYGWGLAVQRGLGWMLRSRTGVCMIGYVCV